LYWWDWLFGWLTSWLAYFGREELGMSPQVFSWLRETGALAGRYILVGLAFVPAGLLYAAWSVAKSGTPFAMILCTGLGFAFAIVVWRFSAPKQVPNTLPVISPAMLAALTGPAAEHWSTVGTQVVTKQQLFAFLLGNPEAGRQLVAIPERSHAFDAQRVWPADVTQGVGSEHAAFSSVSS
jgi:hypothetical protein